MPPSSGTTKLRVCNIPDRITLADLREVVFMPFPVVELSNITNREAIVTFASEDSACDALDALDCLLREVFDGHELGRLLVAPLDETTDTSPEDGGATAPIVVVDGVAFEMMKPKSRPLSQGSSTTMYTDSTIMRTPSNYDMDVSSASVDSIWPRSLAQQSDILALSSPEANSRMDHLLEVECLYELAKQSMPSPLKAHSRMDGLLELQSMYESAKQSMSNPLLTAVEDRNQYNTVVPVEHQHDIDPDNLYDEDGFYVGQQAKDSEEYDENGFLIGPESDVTLAGDIPQDNPHFDNREVVNASSPLLGPITPESLPRERQWDPHFWVHDFGLETVRTSFLAKLEAIRDSTYTELDDENASRDGSEPFPGCMVKVHIPSYRRACSTQESPCARVSLRTSLVSKIEYRSTALPDVLKAGPQSKVPDTGAGKQPINDVNCSDLPTVIPVQPLPLTYNNGFMNALDGTSQVAGNDIGVKFQHLLKTSAFMLPNLEQTQYQAYRPYASNSVAFRVASTVTQTHPCWWKSTEEHAGSDASDYRTIKLQNSTAGVLWTNFEEQHHSFSGPLSNKNKGVSNAARLAGSGKIVASKSRELTRRSRGSPQNHLPSAESNSAPSDCNGTARYVSQDAVRSNFDNMNFGGIAITLMLLYLLERLCGGFVGYLCGFSIIALICRASFPDPENGETH